METKVLDSLKVTEFLCSGRDNLYSSFHKQIFRLSSESAEVLEHRFQENLFDIQSDIFCYVDDKSLKVVNLKKDEVLNSISISSKDVVTSVGLSQSCMHIILGLEDGRIKIIHSLTGEAILNLSLFSSSKSVQRVAFIDDSTILCINQNDLIIIDILQKSKLAKITLTEKIDKLLSSSKDIFYTNDNRVFQISLDNFKTELKPVKIAILEDRVVSVELDFCEDYLWILTQSGLSRYSFGSKSVDNVDVSFDNAKGLAVIDNNNVVVGFENSSLKISNIFEKTEVSKQNNPNLIKFLTVDDSTTVRLVIKRSILNNFKDVEVAEAKDGVEALEYLKSNPDVDVMILDWNMPRMNGDEVVEVVHSTPELRHIKIVMATTEGGADRVKAMISKGVKGYLVKPLKPNSVNPLIEKMIEIVMNEREADE